MQFSLLLLPVIYSPFILPRDVVGPIPCDPTTIELKNVDVIWKHLQLQLFIVPPNMFCSTDGIFCKQRHNAEFEESRGFFRIAEDNKDYSKEQRIKKIIILTIHPRKNTYKRRFW